MGATTHAGVVGADDFFALEFHLGLFHVEVIVYELDKVELDRDLVLPGRDDDLATLHDAFVVYFEFVIERAARGFDESDADTGLRNDFLQWFGMESFLFQEIYRFVNGVEDLDRLGEIVAEDVVGGENLECVFGIVFGARVETGAVDIEARD